MEKNKELETKLGSQVAAFEAQGFKVLELESKLKDIPSGDLVPEAELEAAEAANRLNMANLVANHEKQLEALHASYEESMAELKQQQAEFNASHADASLKDLLAREGGEQQNHQPPLLAAGDGRDSTLKEQLADVLRQLRAAERKLAAAGNAHGGIENGADTKAVIAEGGLDSSTRPASLDAPAAPAAAPTAITAGATLDGTPDATPDATKVSLEAQLVAITAHPDELVRTAAAATAAETEGTSSPVIAIEIQTLEASLAAAATRIQDLEATIERSVLEATALKTQLGRAQAKADEYAGETVNLNIRVGELESVLDHLQAALEKKKEDEDAAQCLVEMQRRTPSHAMFKATLFASRLQRRWKRRQAKLRVEKEEREEKERKEAEAAELAARLLAVEQAEDRLREEQELARQHAEQVEKRLGEEAELMRVRAELEKTHLAEETELLHAQAREMESRLTALDTPERTNQELLEAGRRATAAADATAAAANAAGSGADSDAGAVTGTVTSAPTRADGPNELILVPCPVERPPPLGEGVAIDSVEHQHVLKLLQAQEQEAEALRQQREQDQDRIRQQEQQLHDQEDELQELRRLQVEAADRIGEMASGDGEDGTGRMTEQQARTAERDAEMQLETARQVQQRALLLRASMEEEQELEESSNPDERRLECNAKKIEVLQQEISGLGGWRGALFREDGCVPFAVFHAPHLPRPFLSSLPLTARHLPLAARLSMTPPVRSRAQLG